MRYIISSVLTSTALCLTLPALTSAALAEVPRVVTDIPPVHALVAMVMGDLGRPELLLEQGASAHHFSLRPSQARAVAAADLLVFIGPEMTPWIEGALQNRSGDSLGLLATAGTYRQEFAPQRGAADDPDHDHADGDDHADGQAMAPEAGEEHDPDTHQHDDHDHAAEGHSHSGLDPHAWLDPANGKHWLGVIAAKLSRLDPEHAASYGRNATAARAQIDAADAEARAMLAPVKDQPFAVFHDAYGYFTAHYGLALAGTVALGDAATPGAKRLAALKAQADAAQIRCIFPEAGHDPALIEMLAQGSGLRIGAALDPEGALLEPGAALYTQILTQTAKALADCLKP